MHSIRPRRHTTDVRIASDSAKPIDRKDGWMMELQRLKIWIAAAGCSVAIALATTLWIVPTVRTARAAGTEPPSPDASSDVSAPARYRVGIYGGYVAVFAGDAAEPFRILDTLAASLPARDRALLADGIPVDSEAALQQLLEDYS